MQSILCLAICVCQSPLVVITTSYPVSTLSDTDHINTGNYLLIKPNTWSTALSGLEKTSVFIAS